MMQGAAVMADSILENIEQADEECLRRTGSRAVTVCKHFLTYVLHFIPEAAFLHVTFILFSFMGGSRAFRAVLGCFYLPYLLLRLPGEFLTLLSAGMKEESLWRNPLVPYSSISEIRKRRGNLQEGLKNEA